MSKFWQYQSKAEPLFEDITIDKWFGQSPELIRPNRFRVAVFAAALFFVSVVVPSVPPVDAWCQRLSEPVRIVKRAVSAEIAFTEVITPPAAPDFSWYKELSQPISLRFRQYYYSTAGFRTELGVAITSSLFDVEGREVLLEVSGRQTGFKAEGRQMAFGSGNR